MIDGIVWILRVNSLWFLCKVPKELCDGFCQTFEHVKGPYKLLKSKNCGFIDNWWWYWLLIRAIIFLSNIAVALRTEIIKLNKKKIVIILLVSYLIKYHEIVSLFSITYLILCIFNKYLVNIKKKMFYCPASDRTRWIVKPSGNTLLSTGKSSSISAANCICFFPVVPGFRSPLGTFLSYSC